MSSSHHFGRRLTPSELVALRTKGPAALSSEVRELLERRRAYLTSIGVKPPEHWRESHEEEAPAPPEAHP